MASFSFCFVLMYALWFSTSVSRTMRRTYYRKVDLYRSGLPTVGARSFTVSSTQGSKGRCLLECLSHDVKEDCMAAQYVPETGECYFISFTEYNLQDIPGSALYVTMEWRMVFRSSSGSGLNLYDIWSQDVMDTDLQDKRKATVDPSIKGVYKLGVVDQWWGVVKQVKVSMYNGGVEQMYTVFDAVNSDKMTWFSQSRIIESSYTDIKTSTVQHLEHFSVQGHIIKDLIQRRFFAHGSYDSCEKDEGWFTVSDLDSISPCIWENIQPYPRFFYIPGNQRKAFAHAQEADVFAIYIKI